MEKLFSNMLPVLLHLLLSAVVTSTVTEQPFTCEGDGVLFQGECFYFFPRSHSKWLDANLRCQRENGGHLVTIINQEMNDFIAENVPVHSDVWIGLYDTHQEGNWRWVDDTPVNYTNFGSFETGRRTDVDAAATTLAPEDTNCVMLKGETGKWRDVPCHGLKRMVCALPRGELLCSDGGTFFRDRCYWYNAVHNWDGANQDCENTHGKGVKLAIVQDAELNAFLSRHVYSGVWLGLRYYHNDNMWRWANGEPLDENSYQRWRDGELNDMSGDRDCALLKSQEVNGGYWTRQVCSAYTRHVCAMQPCYDGPSFGSGAGNGDAEADEEPHCENFQKEKVCSCVANALCRLNGKCHCDPLFVGMKCDKDELNVTIHAPRRLAPGANVTMRCHVNLPSTDVTVQWWKVSGTEMFPEDRTRMLDRPEVGDYELILEGLQVEDTGTYVCAATTILGTTGVSEIDSTYLHVKGPNTEKPDTRMVFKGDNKGGISPKETGLIAAVAVLGVCFVCLLVAFIVIKVRHYSAQRRSRRPSDMLM